jgi:hypothetical protein
VVIVQSENDGMVSGDEIECAAGKLRSAGDTRH